MWHNHEYIEDFFQFKQSISCFVTFIKHQTINGILVLHRASRNAIQAMVWSGLNAAHHSDQLTNLIDSLDFLHNRSWISPWIRLLSNKLDIDFHIIVSQYSPVTMIVPTSGHQVRCIPWVQMGTFNKEIGFLCRLKFNRVYIWCCKYGENRYCETCANKKWCASKHTGLLN